MYEEILGGETTTQKDVAKARAVLMGSVRVDMLEVTQTHLRMYTYSNSPAKHKYKTGGNSQVKTKLLNYDL